jgi:hypothetical protein
MRRRGPCRIASPRTARRKPPTEVGRRASGGGASGGSHSYRMFPAPRVAAEGGGHRAGKAQPQVAARFKPPPVASSAAGPTDGADRKPSLDAAQPFLPALAHPEFGAEDVAPHDRAPSAAQGAVIDDRRLRGLRRGGRRRSDDGVQRRVGTDEPLRRVGTLRRLHARRRRLRVNRRRSGRRRRIERASPGHLAGLGGRYRRRIGVGTTPRLRGGANPLALGGLVVHAGGATPPSRRFGFPRPRRLRLFQAREDPTRRSRRAHGRTLSGRGRPGGRLARRREGFFARGEREYVRIADSAGAAPAAPDLDDERLFGVPQ